MGRHSPYATAAEMLGGKPCDTDRLHSDLYDYLTELDDLCELVGGEFVSRQAIALAITEWKRWHPGEKPIDFETIPPRRGVK